MTVRWSEGYAPITGDATNHGILRELAEVITNTSSDTDWILFYPSGFDVIQDTFTLKHTVGTVDTYIEFSMPAKITTVPRSGATATQKDNYYCIEVKFGTMYTAPAQSPGVGTWGTDSDSARARFSWFKSDTKTVVKGWLPVQYWISVQPERIAIVLSGDPSANFEDRLISFGYIGAIKPFKEDTGTDPNTNFGVSVSSDISPLDYLTIDEISQYGDRTGTGVIDLNMLKTYTGFPMQAHYAAFTTPDEFVNKHIEGPSSYTKKYHMSPIYIYHGYDGYRGELYGVVATDRSTIINLDEMIYKYNNTDINGVPNTQDVYKVFLVNAPFSVLNNSTNVLYAIGLLKSSDPIV